MCFLINTYYKLISKKFNFKIITKIFPEVLSIYLLYLLMYIISVMIFTFSNRDFGHPKFLKSQCGHPVMKILAKSLETGYVGSDNSKHTSDKTCKMDMLIWEIYGFSKLLLVTHDLP